MSGLSGSLSSDKEAPPPSLLLEAALWLLRPVPSLPPLVTILFVSIAAAALWIGYHLFLHPLRNVPGPWTERLGLNFWRAWHAWKRDYAWALKALHDRHGAVVRIGPNHVSHISPTAVHTIYAHGAKFDKTRFYLSFISRKGNPSLFSTIDPHDHSERRRSVASAYSMTSLVTLENCVVPCVDALVRQMDAQIGSSASSAGADLSPPRSTSQGVASEQGATLEMSRLLHYFAMDVIGELAFGRSFNFTERNADPDHFLVGVSNLSHFGAVAGWVPSLSTLLIRAQRWWLGQPGGEVVAREARVRMDERYAAVSRGDEVRQDLLAKFMQSKHSPKAKHARAGESFDYTDVFQNAISSIGAGSDTSSATLAAFLVHVVSHPRVYRRLQAEIDAAFDEEGVTEPVAYAQGVKLEYMNACIKETLRLQPPISMSLPRFMPRGGLVIDGVFYPAGTEVSTSPYVYHRSADAYGDDAEEFRPERWLNLGERERGAMERNFLAFGGGSRICIGKNLALMEINKVVPSLLRRYDFSFTPRTPEGPHRCAPRSTDGRESDATTPWTVQSTWFLDGCDLFCDVRLRKEASAMGSVLP